MLPAAHRLRRRQDFSDTVRRGARSGSSALVVHLLLATHSTDPARVGFVVSKAVGNSVTRKQVTRRLRHLSRDRLSALPPGATMVVRALPGASQASFLDLGEQLDRALARCMAPRTRSQTTEPGAGEGAR
jgi:ribonuclease P protein component